MLSVSDLTVLVKMLQSHQMPMKSQETPPLKNRFTSLTAIYVRNGPCHWLTGEPLHNNWR